MRKKKALINSAMSIISFIISFIPIIIVRKFFLDNLGDELLGLNSLFTNIISYLSVIEMGIGSAIIFALYKPFVENDKVKIKGYLEYYSKFYKSVGLIILLSGILLIPFLKYFIVDNIDMQEAKICFFILLMNTVISYFFTYKQCLVNVSQEGYKIIFINMITKIIIAICQICIIIKFSSFIYYLFTQLILNILQFLVINMYIEKKYKWLRNVAGNIEPHEKENLTKNVKALFIHKIGYVLVFGTDNIVISKFINLKAVAQVNSYNIIISAVQGLITSTISSITPTIGNLLVESDKKKIFSIHEKLFFINFWISSFVVISLYNTLSQFIKLWLGEDQVLDNFIISIILINLFITLMRQSVENFKNGSGNYTQDKYASVFEALINLFFSIILVKNIGLSGVFIGTLISNISVVFWIKPKITYKYVFNKPLKLYFKKYFEYCLISIIPFILTQLLTSAIKIECSIEMFLLNCLINIIVINGVYIIYFRNKPEFKYFMEIILVIINKIKF